MTTLHFPTSSDCELETCDLQRLAFEYRNNRDPEVLGLISAELERRDKLWEALTRQRDELAAALRPAIEWGDKYNPEGDPVVVIELTREEYDAIRAALASLETP